jgi:hypothetical protein
MDYDFFTIIAFFLALYLFADNLIIRGKLRDQDCRITELEKALRDS